MANQSKNDVELTSNELLKYAIDNDIIDMKHIQFEIEMRKRQDILNDHPYKITQGKDGMWRTYLPDAEKGRKLVKRKNKASIEDSIISYWQEEEENPSINEVFEEWNQRRLKLKKISAATYTRNQSIFKRHFSSFGDKRIKNTTPEQIEEFLEEQIPEHQLNSKAFSNLKTITRGLLKRAKKRKLISYNVEQIFQELDVSDVDFKKVTKDDCEEVFNDEEMQVIINHLVSNPDLMNLGILLLFVTGLRIGELSALKIDCISENTITIRRTETRYRDSITHKYITEIIECPKTEAGNRIVVVPDDYVWILKKLKQQCTLNQEHNNGYIFYKGNHLIRSQSIRLRHWRNCRKLHIQYRSPHKIRKTYGSILLDNNIDGRMIIGQMGHTDISCTENFYHRNRKSIAEKSKILSSLSEFQY